MKQVAAKQVVAKEYRQGRVAFWAAMLAMAVTACSSPPPKARVDRDSATNFAAYKTFAWFELKEAAAPTESAPAQGAKEKSEEAPKADAPRALDSVLNSRVRSTVVAALQAKGYTLSESNPDFRVSYVLNVYDRPKRSGMSLGVGAGGGSRRAGGGVGLSIPLGKRSETAAAMTIDIIDGVRAQQVWTGASERRVKGDTLSDEDAKAMVDTILQTFPK
ncbi:MAG TPA: DUF4136 domain-containing protein [Steroidobacteraceae bacterium]|nr:DUF4136 domain-containing protein [Steroidobacteraceae bacterium]